MSLNFNIDVFDPDEVFQVEPNFVDPQISFTQGFFVTPSGPTSELTPKAKGYKRWSGDYEYLFKNKTDRFRILNFWQRHYGMLKSFWMPSWVTDFIVESDFTSTFNTFDHTPNGFDKLFNTFSDLSSDYTNPSDPPLLSWGLMWVVDNNAYVSPIINASEGQITLQTPFSETFPKKAIEVCSLVRKVRFYGDRLSLAHETASVGTVNLKFLEVLGE